MATYAHKCTNQECNTVFDVEHKYNDPKSLVFCPVCKSPAKRYIGRDVPFVKYNGYGWGGKSELREAS